MPELYVTYLTIVVFILNNPNIPYASLDPNLILTAIESLGLKCSGSLLALNSYENRVYQVGIEDTTPVIAKFYRPHRWSNAAIIEEHQFTAELAEHEIAAVAPIKTNTNQTLHEYQGFRFALFPRHGGRVLELDNLDQLEWMGRFIGRLHAVGVCQPFKHRLRIDVQSYGYLPYQFLLEQNFIPTELKHNFCHTVEAALQKVELRFQQVGPINYIRLHGDCYAGNVLWNDAGPLMVDFDDCLMGPAIQDIWMLLSGDTSEVDLQLKYILRGYQEFYDFNFCELQLIEALRTLRMIHYCSWLARRWQDPTFPINFPWFNTMAYWQKQLNDLREQVYLLE